MTKRISRLTRRSVLAVSAGAVAIAATAARASSNSASSADFSGRSVLVTGSSSGFGRLTALHLARSGAVVVASMRNLRKGKRAEAQELADIAAQEKLKLHLADIDVTNAAQVASGVARAEDLAGGALDLLVNNAGIGVGGPVELQDERAVFEQMNVNLLGYHRMARAALPKMRERGQGLVVNISSQLGRFVLPNVGIYCTTKFAVEAMCEAMAYELAPFGVEVTIIQPGGYPTKIWENGRIYSDAMLERADAERKGAYEAHIQMSRGIMTGQYSTDAMDVPKAIAEIFALPPGKRPLRRPVHPNPQAAASANAALAQIQAAVLANGPYKEWHGAAAD